MRRAFALALLLAVSACGKADNQPGPGNVTVGEARALDEAAEMIEDRRPAAAATAAATPPPSTVTPAASAS
ncbi:hypothetical protein B0I00_2467 [Novosphingobium kunmingense]|uniref:Lipoprotein n=1 Tax=Novosphingobium kunmingense TaxID=1211806 RepID=A0A2N0H7F3_9SPHN|nr:hypothetical protein [Novosphingobium kunmingense]PKB14865.1 hypothetical protein B0I00_2467 [Novosphingobium kunmingense]